MTINIQINDTENKNNKDLKVKIYEGFRHEILNEAGREQVYRDLEQWMEKRIGK